MSKISIYDVVPVPKLADKLVGTSVGGDPEDLTYNFTLGDLLNLFIPNIPGNTLQGVLNFGNTATQNINLTGTVNTTNLTVSATANILNSNLTGQTKITGGLFDRLNSIGTAGQVLTSTGTQVEWYTIPTVIPNLQQVLTAGNTAVNNIILTGNITANNAALLTATISTSLTLLGTVKDGLNSVGTYNQVLSSNGTGVRWINLPVYSATSPLLYNSGTGIFSIQQANASQGGFLSAADWITFDGKQTAIILTTTGSSGPSTLVGSTINVPNYTLSGLNGVPQTRTLTINGVTFDLSANRSWTIAAGVSSVTASSPLFSTGGATPNITIQQSSSTLDGYLSSVDWLTFNSKQALLGGTGLVKSVGGTISYITDNSANWNTSYDNMIVSAAVTGTTTKLLTLNQQDGGTITASWSDIDTGLTSVGVSMPSAFSVSNSPLTSNGTIAITGSGNTLQYVDGTGALQTFPGLTGFVPYTGATGSVNLGVYSLTATSLIKNGGTSGQFLKADGSVDSSAYIVLGSLSASAPLSYNNLTGAFSIIQSGTVTDGYLSSTDWNTFNNKQGALTLTTTGTSGASTLIGNTLNIPQYTDQFVGTVTSVGLSMPSAFTVSNSPVTSAGTLTVVGAGLASQYVRGDGSLGDFPGGGGGGGSSVSYYLNGSVNQGTFVGNTYYEMSKVPILGAGTDFNIATNGYVAQFITDANDPALLEIPAGNWNFETYFSASSAGGTPSFYIELYKYDGTTFTLIASSVATPELISFGTNIEPYFSSVAVPQTALVVTDRLAIRVYVNNSGRTITLHTEDSHLCQVVTTFTTGLTALNGLTTQVQYFSTGTTGADFNISSAVATHTFNLPTASAANRGALSSADWTTFNNKQPAGNYVTTDTTQTITALKTILRGGDVLDFKIGVDTLYGLKIAYNQNELVPSGEATWSFVNTFNRNSVGFSVTPLAFFRGVLVTGERLISASVNTNLLDYYTNNPSGRYPIYAYNTGVQQFQDSILVGFNTGVVNVVTGAIASLPAGVVANFNGRVIGSNAVNSNEFATLGQLTGGTVTSVGLTSVTSGVTIGSTPITTSGNITIAIATATGSQNGLLSSTDWTTFNSKQGAITLTTTGTSGAATFSSNTLNIPNYGSALTGYVPYTGANQSVDLGYNSLAASFLRVNGTGPTLGSYLGFKHSTNVTTGADGYTSIYTFGTNLIGFKSISGATTRDFSFSMASITPGVPGGRTYTLPDADGTIALVGGAGVGTVTSVAALTLGTSGTDLSSTVANSTTTPAITLNVPTASASARGALSSTDWTTFNNKQGTITLTTTGTSGAATFSSNTLNIPNYGSALSGYLPLAGGTLTGALNGTSAVFSSTLRATKLSLGTSTTTFPINVEDSTQTNSYFALFNTIGTAGATSGIRFGVANGTLTAGNSGEIISRGLSAADAAMDLKVLSNFSLITALSLGSSGAATFSSSVTQSASDSRFLGGDATGRLIISNSGTTTYLGFYGASHSSVPNSLEFVTNSALSMRITSTGNVGIGTASPSAKLELFNSGTATQLIITGGDTSNQRLEVTDGTVTNRFGIFGRTNGDAGVIGTQTNHPLAFNTNNTERMRITSGGNVGIGTTAPISIGGYTALTLNNATTGGILTFQQNGVNKGSIYNDGSSNMYFGNNSGNTIFETTGSERMRITSGGNVLIGTTTDAGFKLDVTGSAQIIKTGTSSALEVGLSGVTGSLIRFKYNAGFVGSISTDGSTTAYNTSSDYRLKEQVRPIDNPLEKVMKLNPVNFKYKNSKTVQDGFIAHEIQEILPYLVTGEKDGIEMQEVDYSKLTPILIAAIKELKQEIDKLKK